MNVSSHAPTHFGFYRQGDSYFVFAGRKSDFKTHNPKPVPLTDHDPKRAELFALRRIPRKWEKDVKELFENTAQRTSEPVFTRIGHIKYSNWQSTLYFESYHPKIGFLDLTYPPSSINLRRAERLGGYVDVVCTTDQKKKGAKTVDVQWDMPVDPSRGAQLEHAGIKRPLPIGDYLRLMRKYINSPHKQEGE